MFWVKIVPVKLELATAKIRGEINNQKHFKMSKKEEKS